MPTAKFGVDISEMNGNVDFNALKKAGVQFVIIRCGYGSDYTNQDDAEFENNVRKAEKAKMPWGTYLYSYAKDTHMAISEANHVLRLLKGRIPAYGVWYDVEDSSQVNSDLVNICLAFHSVMKTNKLYCGIYSFLNWLEGRLNSSKLDGIDKWVAQWSNKCDYRKPYGMWQFTDRFVINGKAFDGNYAYKDYPKITKMEEEDMTDAQTRQIFKEEYNKINPTYHNIDQVPSYWRNDIKELMDLGIVLGNSKNDLGLTKEECKGAVITLRGLKKIDKIKK